MLTLVMMLVVLMTSVRGCSIEEEIMRISIREAMRSELKAKTEVESLRAEMVKMKEEVAWYSLHVAAAAACHVGGALRLVALVLMATRSCQNRTQNPVMTNVARQHTEPVTRMWLSRAVSGRQQSTRRTSDNSTIMDVVQ